MIKQYYFGGLNISLDTQDKAYHDMCKDYETCDKESDMHVKINIVKSIDQIGNVILTRDRVIEREDKNMKHLYYYDNNECYASVNYDKYYKNVILELKEELDLDEMSRDDVGYLLFGMLFNYRLTYFNGLSLHGSTIKYKDNGIIFTAPSGTGKSTQANLWKEKFGKEVNIINDDKPALRFVNNKLICYGTPFAGKYHININDNAEVKAIINVTRGNTNYIERLNSKESLVLLLEETTRSMFNNDVNFNNMKVINNIIKSVPIYRLTCTPDLEAVEVTFEELKNIL